VDLRVVGTNPGGNLQAIFDSGLPQKISQIFTARSKNVPLRINFARRAIKKETFVQITNAD